MKEVGQAFAATLEKERDIKPTENTYIAVTGQLGIEATGDKLLILEDKFRSGYECRTCDGEGTSAEVCKLCLGSGLEAKMPCRGCNGRGKAKCTDCDGEGTPKSRLVVPEDSQRRPSTGTILSIGPKVTEFKVGDKVIYSNFSGVFINLKQRQVMRIMREHEPLGKLYGVSSVIKDVIQ